ncbi:MAG: rhodanese-like domain-containing protein [Ignavibacteriales bacterium]|nr:MAG: rhodanese-like domain-containing protein [Ignavibacteriales bacterium]
MKLRINYRIFAAILILSSAIGIVYNLFNPKGIGLLREQKKIVWASDSLFQNDETVQLKADTRNTDEINKAIDSSKIKLEKSKVISLEDKSLTKPDTLLKTSKPTFIKLNQALKLYNSGRALFVDARDKWDFADGHIKGAINIPEYSFDKSNPVLKSIPKNKTIITYCGGDDCEMSEKLAEYFYELGYKKVFIFFGGWNEWKAANYPTETGE